MHNTAHLFVPCFESLLKNGLFYFLISRAKTMYCTMSNLKKNLTADHMTFFEAQNYSENKR